MGKKEKQNNPGKPASQPQTKKGPNKGNSKGQGKEVQGEKVRLVNMPEKKQGKFKKDFNKNMDKMLAELGLLPDHTGRIKFSKEKKIETVDNYGATFNAERFQNKITKELKTEKVIFSQNPLKKPHTNSKKELVKQMEREKKKKDKKGFIDIEFEGHNLDEKMGNFMSMMKRSHQLEAKPKLKEKINDEPRWKSRQKGREFGGPKDEEKKKEAFQPYEEYLTLEEVEKGLRNKTLYQGIFICNERNVHNSFIKCPNIQERIFFQDPMLKNRALHNAVVVFEILRGKPTEVVEKAESIAEYEAKLLEEEELIENERKKSEHSLEESDEDDHLEDFVKGAKRNKNRKHKGSKVIDLGEDEEEEEEKGAFVDDDEEDEEEDEGDEDENEEGESGEEEEDLEEEDEEEKVIDKIIDKKEKQMFGDADLDDEDEDEELDDEEEDDVTPEIDDSVSDEDIDFNDDMIDIMKKLDKKQKGGNKKKQNNKGPRNGNARNDKEQEAEGKYNEKKRIQAKIVYVVDNPEFSRKFVCTLKKPLNMQHSLMFATPLERKLPFMIVTSAFAPLSTESQKYYLAEYIYWPSNSKFPHGHIIEEIGDVGLIEIESEALLRNHAVFNQEFTEESYDYLKTYEKEMNMETKEYIIPLEEKEKREDLTNQIVFTCDPVTARDLDDALSITHIRDDVYEIGVHIADVSHFVIEGTPLDDDARLRTTSVYLVHKVIPMLPRLLCENLCSLNPGVERLTFSVFFWVKEDGTIIESQPPRITKSFIKTCAKLNYDIVQDMIEKKVISAKELPIVYLPEGVDAEKVLKDCLKMNEIAQNIRKRRFQVGSMSFEREKKRFQLDEAYYPISYKVDKRKDSNFMVEEYMLLANQTVGRYIVDTCQEIALLRCHPPPGNIKINAFEAILEKLGLKMSFESSKSIQDSSTAIFNDSEVSEGYKAVVRFKMCKILEAARYFVVEDTPMKEWRHFALNFDVYTHFTSPIRRYPDVLVHRLLEKCLIYKEDVKKHVNKYHMLAIMDKCNECKLNSKRVSDGCEKLFMCLYLKKNPQYTKAVVTSCASSCIEVYIPLIETDKKIFWKDFKSHKSAELHERDGKRTVKTEFNVEGNNVTMQFKEFELYEIYIYGTDTFPVDFKVQFVHEASPSEKIKLE